MEEKVKMLSVATSRPPVYILAAKRYVSLEPSVVTGLQMTFDVKGPHFVAAWQLEPACMPSFRACRASVSRSGARLPAADPGRPIKKMARHRDSQAESPSRTRSLRIVVI